MLCCVRELVVYLNKDTDSKHFCELQSYSNIWTVSWKIVKLRTMVVSVNLSIYMFAVLYSFTFAKFLEPT